MTPEPTNDTTGASIMTTDLPWKDDHKFALSKCGFLYEPQVFSTSYDKVLVPVPAFTNLYLKTNIVQYKTVAKYVATFTLDQNTTTPEDGDDG
jgi:hypothetical protein